MDIGHWNCEFEFNHEDHYGFIYRVINVVDGREYIGRKNFRMKKRIKVKGRINRKITYTKSNWKKYTTSSKRVNNDIELHGMDIFEFHIIELCQTKAQLTYREVQIQWEERVLEERLENGELKYYNRAIGAIKFVAPEFHTEETIKKISEVQIGKVIKEETRKKISDTLSKPIRQYSLVGEYIKTFKSSTNAGIELDTNASHICACCRSERKTAKGFIWRFENDELTEEYVNYIISKVQPIPVDQYTKEGVYIQTFESGSKASTELGILHSGITNSIKGRRKLAGGYIWKYAKVS